MTRSLTLIALTLFAALTGCQNAPQAKKFSVAEDTEKVKTILQTIDRNFSDTSVYVDDVVHMAQGSRAITSKAELDKTLRAEWAYGRTEMTHELVTLNSYDELVLVRGRVKGQWHPPDGGAASQFETNNLMTFRRMPDGSLKIWQVIFNRIDLDRYK